MPHPALITLRGLISSDTPHTKFTPLETVPPVNEASASRQSFRRLTILTTSFWQTLSDHLHMLRPSLGSLTRVDEVR